MIEKVAISQCLREAYPKDYEGLYTTEELAPTQYNVVVDENGEVLKGNPKAPEDDEQITQGERQSLFFRAHSAFGKENGNEVLKKLLAEEGLQSTTSMTRAEYKKICGKIDDLAMEAEGPDSGEEDSEEEG